MDETATVRVHVKKLEHARIEWWRDGTSTAYAYVSLGGAELVLHGAGGTVAAALIRMGGDAVDHIDDPDELAAIRDAASAVETAAVDRLIDRSGPGHVADDDGVCACCGADDPYEGVCSLRLFRGRQRRLDEESEILALEELAAREAEDVTAAAATGRPEGVRGDAETSS